MQKNTILIIGACGQIGTELTVALRKQYGESQVIAADRHPHNPGMGNYIQLDVLDNDKLLQVVKDRGVTQIYLLAAMLSASGEKDANAAWNLNMKSLLSVLDIAKDQHLDKIFWPSSIAVFGPGSPKYNCPQETRMQPSTVYGISKRTGEVWCSYYFEKFGVDVRSLRYPGLISYTAPAGGGTTDYAVDVFHKALETGKYECFIEEWTVLPMLYMKDAIRATLELMAAPSEKLTIRTSYNIAGMSFAPCDLAAEIKKLLPAFQMSYAPDYRQAIADSWPASIKDDKARNDWGWKPEYNLKDMTTDMLYNLSKIKGIALPDIILPLQQFQEFQIQDSITY